jgi:hypothetical protein
MRGIRGERVVEILEHSAAVFLVANEGFALPKIQFVLRLQELEINFFQLHGSIVPAE